MIKPDDIPPEVVEAAQEAWDGYYNFSKAIAAAINAWPGMDHLGDDYCQPRIVLPLPQKETSE